MILNKKQVRTPENIQFNTEQKIFLELISEITSRPTEKK